MAQIIQKQEEEIVRRFKQIFDRIASLHVELARSNERLEALTRVSYDNIMLVASYGVDRVRRDLPGEYPPPLDDSRPRPRSPPPVQARHTTPERERAPAREFEAGPRPTEQMVSRRRSTSPRRSRTVSRGEEQLSQRASTSRSGDVAEPSRLSECSFCGTKTCKSPAECALRIPFYQRIYKADKTNVCPDRMCVKRHNGRCRQPRIRCNYCSAFHHKIYCEAYARKTNNL